MPVTGFAANFSPIPRIAPPPLGRLSEGNGVVFAGESGRCDELAFPDRSLGADFPFDGPSFGCIPFADARVLSN